MKYKVRKKIGMYTLIYNLMEEKLPVWNSIPEIRKTYDDFVENYKKLRQLQDEQLNGSAPLKRDLKMKRKALKERLEPVCSVLSVAAEDSGRKDLLKRINKVLAKLGKASDAELIDDCQIAGQAFMEVRAQEKQVVVGLQSDVEIVSVERKELASYGLTEEMISLLDDGVEDFSDILMLRKAEVVAGKNCLRKMDGLIEANESVLKNRLDKLLSLFRNSDAEFYESYMEIRKKRS